MSKHFWSKNIKKLIQLIIILIFFRLFYDKHDVYAHLIASERWNYENYQKSICLIKELLKVYNHMN